MKNEYLHNPGGGGNSRGEPYPMNTCAVYARVSTDMQGDSLENQVEYATEYVRRLGSGYCVNKDYIYTDYQQSGYYTRFVQRPAIQRALEDAKEHKYNVILFKEISRISRDSAEHIEIVSRFTQYGVRVIAINDNLDSDRPETLDLLGMHSVMSEMESKRISSRVSSGKKSLARRGYWLGEAPIGYKVNPKTRRLEVDELLSHIPKLIFHLFTVDRYGTFKVADYLNQRQLYTKHGSRWSRATVRRVLNNPAYSGDFVYGRTRNALKRIFDEDGYSKVQSRKSVPESDWVVLRDAHPALIPRETFALAQAILSTRKHHNPRRARHPLTGILRCGRCGGGMICQTQRHKSTIYRYYSCSRAFRFGRSACDQPNLNAGELERGVWHQLILMAGKHQNQNFIITPSGSKPADLQTRHRQAQRALHDAQTGLARLLMDTELPVDSFRKLKSDYEHLIVRLESEIQQVTVEPGTPFPNYARTMSGAEFLDELRYTDLKNLDETRRKVHDVFTRIVVDGYEVTEMETRFRV